LIVILGNKLDLNQETHFTIDLVLIFQMNFVSEVLGQAEIVFFNADGCLVLVQNVYVYCHYCWHARNHQYPQSKDVGNIVTVFHGIPFVPGINH